jgi:hypothetical protein
MEASKNYNLRTTALTVQFPANFNGAPTGQTNPSLMPGILPVIALYSMACANKNF